MRVFLERFVHLQAAIPVPATLGPFWDAEIYAAAVLVSFFLLYAALLHAPPAYSLRHHNAQHTRRRKLAAS